MKDEKAARTHGHGGFGLCKDVAHAPAGAEGQGRILKRVFKPGQAHAACLGCGREQG